MDSTVKKHAKEFAKEMIRVHLNSRFRIKNNFQNELKNKLGTYHQNVHRFDFIDQYISDIEEFYKTHLDSPCTNPENCPINNNCKDAIFFAEEEKENLNNIIKNEASRQVFSTYNSINITGHGSILNIGEIKDSIINNSQRLESTGHNKVSENFQELTRAIEEANELTVNDKTEYLETVEYLSQQALLEENKRNNRNILKNIIKGLSQSLNVVSSISTIVGKNINEISKYFLEP